MDLTRRDFFKGSGVTALALSLGQLRFGVSAVGAQEALKEYEYRGWEDLYRQKWKWDKVVKATHQHTNCAKGCAWQVFVKEGMVWREEQVAYPQTNPNIPSWAPRGCTQGACYSVDMYKPGRLRHPLKRAGARGEGKWKRISWDEALTEFADSIINAVQNHGSETIINVLGPIFSGDPAPASAGLMRFFDLIGGFMLDATWLLTGDLSLGLAITYGNQNYEGGTSDEWFLSDYIVFWCWNPMYTRVPDYHFYTEARYKGAKLVTVATDYSASSIHTDMGVSPRMGTDTALALGMCKVIIDEGLYKADYLKEQTDLPFLVREDTGKFLRESDMEAGGKEGILYFWDLKSGGLAKTPGSWDSEVKSLRLNGLDPALEGTWEVETRDGKRVKVRPVFELLKERLKDYTPEKVAEICGVKTGNGTTISADLVRRFAREYAQAKAGLITGGWGNNKIVHSDLMQRAFCLLAALPGHTGKPGGGFRVGSGWNTSAGSFYFPITSGAKGKGSEDVGGWAGTGHRVGSTLPWLYYHAGMKEIMGKKEYVDPELKREVHEYVREAIEKEWRPVFPKPGKDPKVLINMGVNYLREVRSPQYSLRHLWPKLDLVVTIDYRMGCTATYSDILLPAAAWYEKTGCKYCMFMTPFLYFNDKAVEPLEESKEEWEIFGLLAKKVAERAKEKGVTEFTDGVLGVKRDLTKIYDEYTENGKWGLQDQEGVMQRILDNMPLAKGITVKELKEKGYVLLPNPGPPDTPGWAVTGKWRWKEGMPYVPGTRYVEDKEPWPTLTGRQQFYIDHDWFLECDEHLPRHKEPPKMGGNYPLAVVTGHPRWSIHSTYRDNPLMLKLQRGEPVIYMSPQDATAREIKDHDYVRVYNDVGEYITRVKVSPSAQPGQIHLYHGWEMYQFRNHNNNEVVSPGPIKPVNLVGNYYHLFTYYAGQYDATMKDKGTFVEVKKA